MKTKLGKGPARLRNCSKCGKLSSNGIGEYTRTDGSSGYINQEEGETAPVCTECRDAAPTDAERLDWLEKNASCFCLEAAFAGPIIWKRFRLTLRAAIDAAMKAEKGEKP